MTQHCETAGTLAGYAEAHLAGTETVMNPKMQI